MICLTVPPTGPLTADTTPVDSCPAGTYVLLTQSEFDQYAVSPWKLGLEEAGSIVGAVLFLWALAFGFRMAIRAIRDSGDVGSDSTD